MITLQDVKNNKEIEALIKSGQRQLDALGYTEHSERHINIVAQRAGDLLEILGYPKDRIELARITEIMTAIGNHDENTGNAVSDISAAIILADKSDVHRDRVTDNNISRFGIHHRVNYAVTDSKFIINKEDRKVTLDLTIDTKISPVLDYFEIFMERTMMSKHAAKYLNIWFELIINDTRLL